MKLQWIFLFFCGTSLKAQHAPSLVHTSLGDVQGVADEESRYFLGVPYAEAPIEALRFRQAAPKSPWEDVYDATNLKPSCPQEGRESQSEDCLYLQIYTPPHIVPGTLFPVLFWIHGGGFVTGSGADYNGTHLANQGTVVVTINYRLGAFGFLQSKFLQSEDPSWPSLGGMNGVNDQLVALQWTIDNIAAFGGNPNDITISGESAGSCSVCYHLISLHSKDMFNNAILESGSCIGPWRLIDSFQGLEASQNLMDSLGVTNVEQLRRLSASEISSNPSFTDIQPSIDEFWLSKQPIEYFQAGELSIRRGGRILLGGNTQDTVFGFPYYLPPGAPTTKDMYNANFEKYFGRQVAHEIEAFYPVLGTSVESIQKAWLAANSDCCVTCPTRFLADIIATNHPVFLYRFGYNPGYPSYQWKDLAAHGFEIPFVFHEQISDWPYDEDLSNIVVGYWTDFIHGTQKTEPIWDEYKSGEETYLSIEESVSMKKGYQKAQCDFWHEYTQNPTNFNNWVLFGNQGFHAKNTTRHKS